MAMRPGALATAVVMASFAFVSAAAARTGCGPPAAKTLATDSLARVYSTNGSVYGCADSAARSYLLAADQSRPGQAHIGRLALAGVDVAFGESTSGVDTLSAEVIVRRLDDGRTLHDVSATTGPLPAEGFQSVQAIVVKPDGAVAWIAEGGSIVSHANTEEVDRIDRRGEATLEANAGFDFRELRLQGSRLSWRHENVVRTATLL